MCVFMCIYIYDNIEYHVICICIYNVYYGIYTHDGSMVLLYMVCHGSHQNTPFMLAYISYMDDMGYIYIYVYIYMITSCFGIGTFCFLLFFGRSFFETLALGLGTCITIGMFSGMGILPSRQAWLAGKYTKKTEAWKKWMFIAGNTGRNGCLVRWKNHLQLENLQPASRLMTALRVSYMASYASPHRIDQDFLMEMGRNLLMGSRPILDIDWIDGFFWLKKNTFQYFYTYVFVGIEQRKNQLMLVGGWANPLKNDGVRQLGIWFPIYGKIKAMFQTTNQNRYLSPNLRI